MTGAPGQSMEATSDSPGSTLIQSFQAANQRSFDFSAVAEEEEASGPRRSRWSELDLLRTLSRQGLGTLWVMVMLLWYPAVWQVGQLSHLYHGPVPTRLDMRCFSMVVFAMLTTLLFLVGDLPVRLRTLGRFLAFNGGVCATSLLLSPIQAIAGLNITLTSDSIASWPWYIWLAALVLICVTGLTLIKQVTRIPNNRPKIERVTPWLLGALALGAIMHLASKNGHAIHIHHWFVGFVGAVLFREADVPTSFVAQAIATGVFVHGAAVFGCETIFDDLVS